MGVWSGTASLLLGIIAGLLTHQLAAAVHAAIDEMRGAARTGLSFVDVGGTRREILTVLPVSIALAAHADTITRAEL